MARDGRATSALEFGLIAPLFVLMTVFLFEIGFDFFAQQVIDYATAQAARQIQTGQVQNMVPTPPQTASEFHDAILCPASLGLLPCDSLMVSVSAMPPGSDFHDYQPVPPLRTMDMTYCNGGPSQMMLVSVVYMAPVFFANFFPSVTSFNGSAALPITSQLAFIDEGFPALVGSTC